MAKNSRRFFCKSCGHEELRWLGRCPGCGAWNTMQEMKIAPTGGGAKGARGFKADGPAGPVGFARGQGRGRVEPLPLAAVASAEARRLPVEPAEVARVLGGGLVEVVRGEQDRQAAASKLSKDVVDLLASPRIDTHRGLVQKQDARFRGQGLTDGQPLLHPRQGIFDPDWPQALGCRLEKFQALGKTGLARKEMGQIDRRLFLPGAPLVFFNILDDDAPFGGQLDKGLEYGLMVDVQYLAALGHEMFPGSVNVAIAGQ